MNIFHCNKRNVRSILRLMLSGIAACVFIMLLRTVTMTTQPVTTHSVQQQTPLKMDSVIGQIKLSPNGNRNGKVEIVMSVNARDLLQLIPFDVERRHSSGGFNDSELPNPPPKEVPLLLHNDHLCSSVTKLRWVNIVYSHLENFEARHICRNTWASLELFRESLFRVVFLVGRSSNDTLDKMLLEEFKEFGDIVQGDFVDHVRNATLKGLMGLRWVTKYCSNARYVIKTNEDTFVNIFHLMSVMEQQEKESMCLACPLWKENTMPILRDPAQCGQWCVDEKEFPQRNHFPKYCASHGYMLSMDLASEMSRVARATPFFWIDDVFITGVLPRKVNGSIVYVDLLSNFTSNEKNGLDQYSSSTAPITYHLIRTKSAESFVSLWKMLLHRLSAAQVRLLSDNTIKKYIT